MRSNNGRSLSRTAVAGALAAALVLGLATALAPAGCSNPLTGIAAENPSEVTGALRLTINSATARTLQPPIDMNPAAYSVSGSNSNGASFQESSAASEVTIGSLSFGTWTVTVEALNAAGTLVGRGQGSVSVNAGRTSSLAVLVLPLQGYGTLALSLCWDAAQTQNPSIEARLTPPAGSAIDLAFLLQAPGVAACTRTDIPAGYYTLELRLLDNGILCMGAVEVVRIVADQTTSGLFEFTEVNTPGAGIAVNITPALNDPIAVTLSGQADALELGSSMTVTAAVPAGIGNVVCAWFLNGQAKATGASYTLGASLPAGVYRLDVSVFSADGGRAGSGSHVFRVNAAPLAQAALIWDANSEPDLAGYKLHYGLASGSYETVVDVGNQTQFTLTGLQASRTYYIAATAYNSAGMESGYSNEVVFRGSS
jgi:hypothetical protein